MSPCPTVGEGPNNFQTWDVFERAVHPHVAICGWRPTQLSTAKCGISSRQRLRSLRVAMVFRKPRAVFFLVLVVVLCSWPVRRVFVGQGGAEPRPQRSRMRSSPCQNDWKADSFESSRVPLEIGEHRPMIDGRPLEVGALVGFELYEFSKLIHVGIYAGRGDERLRNLTGVKSLSPLKHYVIEFSGPCQRSNSMISQVGLVIQGQGGQCIHIAELTPSFNWHMYEINSIDYGPPLSGEETLRRAVGQIGTQFGGYDVFGNNCQHFAVWARYNETKMLPPEEQLQAKAGTMYQEIVDFKWVYANHELQKIMPEWEVQIQEKEKMWKRLQEVTEAQRASSGFIIDT